MNLEDYDSSLVSCTSSSGSTNQKSSSYMVTANFDQLANNSTTSTTITDDDTTTTTTSPHLVPRKKNAGQKKLKVARHRNYRGVRERSPGKWVSEVRGTNKQNSRIWLGTYPTPEMAARAYDIAAIALRGDSATLNFSDSLWILPRAQSSSTQDIQLAAVQGAEAFRPTDSSFSSSSVSSRTSLQYSLLQSCSAPKSTYDAENARKVLESASTSSFLDEEALFNMPALLAGMAEGMLIAPLDMQEDFHNLDDDMDKSNVDWTLWRD